jgi:hypothetical protein
MSSYGLSLLTNRRFLIDIRHPCNLNELLLPNEINWNIKDQILNGTQTSLYCIDAPTCVNHFKNVNMSNFEIDNNIVNIQLNNDWLAHFSNDKQIQDYVVKLGYSPEKFKLIYMMNEWYTKLFKLSPLMQEKYDLIKENAKITSNTKIYCAQIRIGGKRPNVPHDAPFNSLNVTKLFWQFIRENFIDTSNDDWKLFITTDIEVVEIEALKEFGKDKILRIPGIFSHVDMETNSKDCSRIEKPILDFHFLQNCDKAVISSIVNLKSSQV